MTIEQKSNYVSPIKFSEVIGKKPQQVYTWLRENKIPADCIQEDMFSDKKLIILDKAVQWFNSRQTRSTSSVNPVQMMSQDPSKMLEMMIGWFEQAGQTNLAESLTGVLEQMKNPIPEVKE